MNISSAGAHVSQAHAGFKSGRTYIYTDFDDTNMHFFQDEICKNSPLWFFEERRNGFNHYFPGIFRFFDSEKGKLTLFAATEHVPSEYFFVEKTIKDKRLKYRSPDALILRSGGDNFD